MISVVKLQYDWVVTIYLIMTAWTRLSSWETLAEGGGVKSESNWILFDWSKSKSERLCVIFGKLVLWGQPSFGAKEASEFANIWMWYIQKVKVVAAWEEMNKEVIWGLTKGALLMHSRSANFCVLSLAQICCIVYLCSLQLEYNSVMKTFSVWRTKANYSSVAM